MFFVPHVSSVTLGVWCRELNRSSELKVHAVKMRGSMLSSTTNNP